MGRKHILAIPEPCSQNWDSMQSAENGKYCLSCQSNVYDFTGKTDQEIVDALKKSKGHLCGRLLPEQMNRVLYTQPYFRFPMRAGLASALLLLAGAYPLLASTSEGRELRVATTFCEDIGPEPVLKQTGPSDSVTYVLKGYVKNSSNVRLAGAKVLLDSSEVFTQTNANGYFELSFKAPADQEGFVFEILCSQYANQIQKISKQELLAGSKVKFTLWPYRSFTGRIRDLNSNISW